MKIGLVHVTDIHFTTKTDISKKIAPLCRAVINDFADISHIYFIISGDVANTGDSAEYKQAESFLSISKQFIQGEKKDIIIKYIIVPGNHDCNFALDTQLRKNSLNTINYESIGSDDSVLKICLSVQEPFWEFYKKYNEIPQDKLYYTVTEQIGDYKIIFHCLNTAWVSQLNESPGKIFFPVKNYEPKSFSITHLNIGVWHHPLNWFNPNTQENNKKEFENFIETVAPIHFFGHEHEQGFYINENKNSGAKVNLLSGELFNDGREKKSGFQIVVLDLLENKGFLKKYKWQKDFYDSHKKDEIDIYKYQFKQYKINPVFAQKLEELKIPLKIDNRKEIKLPEVFIYPDLEFLNSESKDLERYTSSLRLLNDSSEYSIIDGEAQIGKTSLLSMLYLDLLENDVVPLFLQGSHIVDKNLDTILERNFHEQYLDENFERFNQLDKKNKALLIDDFHDCIFNSNTSRDILENLQTRFGKVIVTIDSANSFLSAMLGEIKNTNFFSIKPLGYKKRNELIEKYQLLKHNSLTTDEQTFLDSVKTSFDNVQSVLGDKLMPSYPIYILSILSALEYKPLNQDETSFGYCYQTLIHYALVKADVKNEDIDGYLNFLTELAYHYIEHDISFVSTEELIKFFASYQEKYIAIPYDTLISTLKKSKIIIEKNAHTEFGYSYILYFLGAKKISDIIHTKEGKNIIKKFFEKVHIERYAYILVFITHHSKDISFIEDSLINSMALLENLTPISLEKNDIFYSRIEDIAKEVKKDILHADKKPKQERDQMLASRDEQQRDLQEEHINEEDINEIVLPFQQAFRSIEIVGQIIKNRKRSLEIPQLVQMVAELYLTGFRTVSYLSDMLEKDKSELVDSVLKNEKNIDRNEVEDKIKKLLQMISLQACFSVFHKLTLSLGSKDLKKIYLTVAKEINTPAAKLVTFGINSYYSTVNIDEIKQLSEDFKNNMVAMRILRGRVKSYVYNRNLDYKTKQKIANALNMELIQKVNTNEKQ